MKKMIALLILLLILPVAALAWEEASTPLTVTLTYEPHRVLAVGTVHRSWTELDYDMLDENGDYYNATLEYDDLTHFKLDLPQGWLLCEGASDGAFAAWRSPDGGIHAEFCYLTLPLDREWYFDAMLGRVVGGENLLITATRIAIRICIRGCPPSACAISARRWTHTASIVIPTSCTSGRTSGRWCSTRNALASVWCSGRTKAWNCPAKRCWWRLRQRWNAYRGGIMRPSNMQVNKCTEQPCMVKNHAGPFW